MIKTMAIPIIYPTINPGLYGESFALLTFEDGVRNHDFKLISPGFEKCQKCKINIILNHFGRLIQGTHFPSCEEQIMQKVLKND